MKRKFLFFTLLCALVACIFAISASAKHEYTPLTDEALSDLDVKIVLTDGTNEFDAEIKFKELFNYTLASQTETAAYALKLSDIKATSITISGVEYTLKESMAAIYFPDGITHLNTNFMKQYSTVFSKACLPDSLEFIGDCVFYKCGTFSLIDENGNLDNYLPENLCAIGNASGSGSDHFLSGCALQNSMLIFPESLTNFGCDYSFNDGFTQKDNMLILVFLGKMTNVNVGNSIQNSARFRFYFTKNTAEEALVTASKVATNRVETRLVDGKWTYAYRDSALGSDISTAIDTEGKTLTVNINNNDPNSTSLAGSYDNKDWLYLSDQAPIFYFCSGEMLLTFRNGTFGWRVYVSDPIQADDVHPFEDGGVDVEATCTIGAGTRYSCGVCGAFIRLENETGVALGHDYTEENLVSSTALGCKQDETKTYECQRCSEQFTVIVTESTGHDMSIITYPIEATYTSLGFKRLQCSKCDYYTEYEYRLDPSGAMMSIVLDDGTELSLLASLIFNVTFTEETQIASITGLKEAFTLDGVSYKTDDVYKITVPFGFNHLGYGFSNGRAVEVYDFSLTKDLILGNGAFRDNHLVEQVILGDGATPLTDAFRATARLFSIVIADGATVTFPNNANPFNDNKNVQEFIIGKGANVNFAKENFKGTMNSIARIVIGDGATVNFAKSAFSWLSGLKTFSIGKGCNVTFGTDSFGNNQNLTELTIGDSSTVVFGSNAFYKALALETFTVGENCNLSFSSDSFSSLTTLTELYLPDSTTITFSGNNAFKYCTALEIVYLPASVTSLPKETFAGCTALKSVALMGVTSIGEKAFGLDSSIEGTLTIYSHATGNLTINSSAFNNRTSVVLYTMSTNVTSLSIGTYTIYVGIPHAQYEAKLDPTCTLDGYDGYATDCPCGNIMSEVTYTIYASGAEATTGSYGIHTVIPNLGGHTDKIVIIYASGFDKAGEKTVVCGLCNEPLAEATPTNPIFTHKGYSYKLNGDVTGIQSGFDIDKEALKAYEDANSKLTFGIVIINPTYLGDTFFKDGIVNASKGVIQVSVEVGDYSTFSCYISGFQKDSALSSLELVIAGYAYENDPSSICLMQKSYNIGENAPVVSNVSKQDGELYTVSITNVQVNVPLPEKVKEYGSAE